MRRRRTNEIPSILSSSPTLPATAWMLPLCPPNLPSPRVSTRHLKQLLGRVCRVAEDGKRLLFEYSQRLAPAAVDAKDGAGVLVEGDGNRAGKTPLESQRTA